MANTICLEYICNGVRVSRGSLKKDKPAECSLNCDFNWRGGRSGQGEHIFNNVGGMVGGICATLQTNVGDNGFLDVETDKEYAKIRRGNCDLITTLQTDILTCKTKTGHQNSESVGVGDVKPTGICGDPSNADSFSTFSTKIKDYVALVKFADSMTYHEEQEREKIQVLAIDFMTNRKAIEKIVIDEGAKYSARFILKNPTKESVFDTWFKTTKEQVFSLLNKLDETIKKIRDCIDTYVP